MASWRAISVLLVCTGFPSLARAQVSAGQMLQENRQLAPPTVVVPEALRDETPMELRPLERNPDQLAFTVHQFVFVGNRKLPEAVLQPLVAEFKDVEISFDDLQRITDAVAELYRSKGWLARVFLPQQDITEGSVTINIIEAKFGGVVIDNQSQHIGDDQVQAWIYERIPMEVDLSLDELERTLLVLNDLPDLSVAGSLQQGERSGETRLLLTVTDKPGFNGQLTADSYGGSSSGKVRASALLNANGLLTAGDQLAFYGMDSLGSVYVRTSYSLAVGASGLRMGINASTMDYKVLGASFSSLATSGYATTEGIEVSLPLIRSKPMNMMGSANFTHNRFRNFANGAESVANSYDTNVVQYGVSGNLLDSWMDGGLNTWSFMVSEGENGKDPSTQAQQVAGVAGSFAKLRYSLNRTQTLSDTTSGYVSLSGQWASRNMDSSEELYLGGPTNVRSYGGSQGGATQGNLATFELRQNLPNQIQLTGFYDVGNVQMFKFNTPGVDYNTFSLQGFGASLTWLGSDGLMLKATVAHRFGEMGSAVYTYLSQNGGLSANRLWLNASIPFSF